jgi:DMSO/TMAO reductase YedYZ heme-binding membrane subunit
MDTGNRVNLWTRPLVFSFFLYLKAALYMFIYYGGVNFVALSESLAFAGGILIGASFVLSTLSYFFDFMDSKLKYRKQLGLLGYYFALAYSITLLIRNRDWYIGHWRESFIQPEALLGLSARAILTMMAIISGNWAVKILGSHWRTLLRTGYIAYVFLIVRALLVEGDMWREWLVTQTTVAPPRLMLTVFALMVIYARIGLEIALRYRHHDS